MKIQPYFFVLLVILIGNTKSFSQVTDSTISVKKNYFYLSPLSLLDVVNPSVSLGYERLLSDKIAIQIEGGPIIKHSLIGYFFTGLGFGTQGAWWTNEGAKIRTEIKFYETIKFDKRLNTYFSVEFFLTRNSSNVTQLFTVSDSTYDYTNKDIRFAGDGIYDDFYVIHRKRFGVNFKHGFKEYEKNKITFDSSVGLGLAYQILIESSRANYNDTPFQGSWPFLKPGKRILPTLTIGVKIGLKK